ncbi:glycosyltransferase family 4 protein [Omnitrophica bacterium]|nr:glycosyltransferase family 4 protein [Candidatus Omnitrophota bacterium]
MECPRRKIKILRIKTRLTIGGPDIHVLLLNSGLDKERFESYLAVGAVEKGEPDMTYLAQEMGLEFFVIPELKRGIRLKDDFVAFLKLYRLMRKLKPDIVHTHTAKAGTLGTLAAIISRVPIRIHTYHGHVFHSYFGKSRTRLFIIVERILARFRNKIIVISQSQFKDVKDIYRIAPEKKCPLIPLGLDLEPFLRQGVRKDNSHAAGDFKRRSSIDEDTSLVGMIGRLVDVKNIKMFLDAAKRIKRDAPAMKVKFLIVGDGTQRSDLESYASMLNIEDSVIFRGYLPELIGERAELVSIYKDLDVVALTSLNEGTPISLIEAMASGKAVVSTDVGGVRDVVTHNASGLLSPSQDVERFCSHLLGLLRDKTRREEMGRTGRVFVSKMFSKERLLRDIEKLYDEEVEKRSLL